jgi:hypothetical protein
MTRFLPLRTLRALAIVPVVALSTLALGAAPAAAQFFPSVLSLLPTNGRVVQVGSSGVGTISLDDYRSPEGVPLQAWDIRGEPGTFIWIDVVSEVFDSFLYVLEEGRREILFDDDSAGGCDSRIPVEIPASGVIRAIVSQTGTVGVGAFTVHATTQPRELTEGFCAYSSAWDDELYEPWQIPENIPVAGRMTTVPGTVTGTLSAEGAVTGPLGGPMVAWEVELAVGEILQFDLISDAFDPVMILVGPGIDGFLEDDDSGGDLNSQLIFTPLVAGTYRVFVTSFGDGVGDYTLRIAARSGTEASTPSR